MARQAKGVTFPIIYKADLSGLKSAEGALQKFGKMAAGIGAAAVGAVTGVAVSGIKAFAEFDSKLQQSVAIMGDVSDALRDDMASAAREVAKTTTFSAAEAAESYFFLASAGLDAEQSIAALPQVAAFAQAGMFDMATATDLLTDAQSALGLTSEDTAVNLQNMTELSDVLVKANTLANASVSQFSEALTNKAAASMRSLNMDMEEGVAVLAVFADQGIKGSQAGTTFNATIRGLTQGVQRNASEFQRLGVEVFNADGELNNMADIVGDLEGALSGMSVEQQRAELTALGMTEETLAGTLALLGNSEAIREYESELRNAGGTVDEVAAKQLETLSSQMELMKSQFEDIGIEVGSVLVPILSEMMTTLGPVIGEIGVAVGEAFQDLGPVFAEIAGLIPGLVQAFIPLIPIIGEIAAVFFEIISAVLPIFVDLVSQLMPLFETLVPILADAFMSVIVALVPIIVSLAEALVPIVMALLPPLIEIFTALAPILVTLIEAFLPLIEMILPYIIGFLELLSPILVWLAELIGLILVEAVGFLTEKFQAFMDFLSPFVEFFEETFGGVKEFFFGIVNGMIELFEGFVNGIIGGLNWLIRQINKLQIRVPETPFNKAFTMGFNFKELSQISIPRIALAEGGIVTGPINALVGEAGPEAVIPLDKLDSMGSNYYITVNTGVGDPVRIGQEVVTYIKRYERASGKVFVSA